MTSTFSRTNSAAISDARSLRPSAQRYSIAMVRPSLMGDAFMDLHAPSRSASHLTTWTPAPASRAAAKGLDNYAMGTIFEELVRRFNEENNEEAGEHWTPRAMRSGSWPI